MYLFVHGYKIMWGYYERKWRYYMISILFKIENEKNIIFCTYKSLKIKRLLSNQPSNKF